MPNNDPQTQLVKYLTDVHSIEEQARIQMERAPKLVEGKFSESFQRHLGETESQEQRVRERLEAHDASPSKLKDVAGKVAAYELLAIAAREAGDEETASLAEVIADEEREMAGWIAASWDEAVEQAL